MAVCFMFCSYENLVLVGKEYWYESLHKRFCDVDYRYRGRKLLFALCFALTKLLYWLGKNTCIKVYMSCFAMYKSN